MEAFIRVVGAGSFSAAARAMKLSPSAVSKLMSRIESQLGVRLVDRSTRQLKLTPEGEIYYNHCVKIVSDIEEAEHAVMAHLDQPRGRLRVNSTMGVGVHQILPVVPEFLSRFPQIELDLSLSDEVVDLIEEQAEVAIRVGPLQDSSLKARKICDNRRVVVAAPSYLEEHGIPRHPDDLLHRNCLTYNLRSTLNEWPFMVDDAVRQITVKGNFRGNSGETLRQLAVGGAGIARLGWFQVGEDVKQGRLVPLLEEFHAGEHQGVFAVFFGARHTSVRVRCFVDFLVEKLGRVQPWTAAGASLTTKQPEHSDTEGTLATQISAGTRRARWRERAAKDL